MVKAMIISCSSHRAIARLKALYPDAQAYYYEPTLFQKHSFKAYYLVSAIKHTAMPKGCAVARDQNINNYGRCWS